MTKPQNKYIILIVSAYSSGIHIAPILSGRGYTCIHVTTEREWHIDRLRLMYDGAGFVKNIILKNEYDLSHLNKELESKTVLHVITGSESGVLLSDVLCVHFQVHGNDINLTSARRNKFDMIQAIKQKNLLSPDQIKSCSLSEILSWVRTKKFPCVVLKPLSSSSSDHVFYCKNSSEITQAFYSIYKNKDMYEEVNEEVLVQEYIDGEEYIVNTVSCDGEPIVTDIWRGVSRDQSLVSQDAYAELILPHSPEYLILKEYVEKVLSALKIRYGAAHSEIRLSGRGPCLIEIGARLAGKVNFSMVEKIFSYSQLSLLIESYLEPAQFKWRCANQDRLIDNNKKIFSYYVYFTSVYHGLIKNQVDLTDFFKIPSLCSVTCTLKKNDLLMATNKALRHKRAGYAYLISESEETIKQDYAALRVVEDALYLNLIHE